MDPVELQIKAARSSTQANYWSMSVDCEEGGCSLPSSICFFVLHLCHSAVASPFFLAVTAAWIIMHSHFEQFGIPLRFCCATIGTTPPIAVLYL